MKRLFAHLIALMLFPQVISAVILVPRPQKAFSVSQTYVVSNRGHENMSDITSKVWLSRNNCRLNGKWHVGSLQYQERQNYSNISYKNLCQHKALPYEKHLNTKIDHSPYRRLCQVR